MIILCNVKSAACSIHKPLSIAIKDEKRDNALPLFMPTWAMVGGLKYAQGDERFKRYSPLTVEEYREQYRALLVSRKAEIVRWQHRNKYNDLTLYCYCKPVPSPALFDVEDLSGETWFCHRLLLFHLFRRWFPSMSVSLF